MKGFVNLPTLTQAHDQILIVEEDLFIPQKTWLRRARAGKSRERRAVAAPKEQVRPKYLHQPKWGIDAPFEFVAACYANTCDGRTRSVGCQVNVKV